MKEANIPGSNPFWSGAAAKVGCAALVAVIGAVSAQAAADSVSARQAAMKQIGSSMKAGSGYASGTTAWDPAKVKTLMSDVSGNAKSARKLFPATSANHPKSSADPKIWRSNADFQKRLTELGAFADMAGEAPNQAAFQTSFRQLGTTCKSCHDLYRKKPS